MNSLARSLLLSLLASFLIFGCCERTTGPSSLSLLSVDAQSNFQNDVVKVEIDDHVFFEDTLMTDFSLGLAYSKQTYVATGAHRIRVAIPSQSAQKEFHVTVKDTLTVGIHYNRSTNELDYSTYNFILRYR